MPSTRAINGIVGRLGVFLSFAFSEASVGYSRPRRRLAKSRWPFPPTLRGPFLIALPRSNFSRSILGSAPNATGVFRRLCIYDVQLGEETETAPAGTAVFESANEGNCSKIEPADC